MAWTANRSRMWESVAGSMCGVGVGEGKCHYFMMFFIKSVQCSEYYVMLGF
jgi:hypothetical protein